MTILVQQLQVVKRIIPTVYTLVPMMNLPRLGLREQLATL